jgi:hypothetical protein
MDVFTSNDRTNNYRAALVAKAAYLSNPVADAAARKIFEKEQCIESRILWWSHRNASGVAIVLGSDRIVIGISGTNSAADFGNDISLRPLVMDWEWEDINGIALDRDARGTVTTEGFAGFAACCYHGIVDCLHESGVTHIEAKKIVLCGHSLGGAAVQLIQLSHTFECSTSYTFGGARAFHRSSIIPVRLRNSTVRCTDPVVYQPWTCKPAGARMRYLSRSSIGSRPTISQTWITSAFLAIYWAAGLVGSALAYFGAPIPASLKIDFGHGMSRYVEDCW